MKYVFIILAVLVVVIIGVVALLAANGLFVKPEVENKTVGPFRLVYNEHIGEYKGTKVVMDKVYEDLLNLDISTTKGFGIYFDNPQTTPKDQLRSYAGCIVEVADYEKLTLDNKPAKVADFPQQECYYSEFPFKGPFSVIMGIVKVYPEIHKFAGNDMELPIMEIYDVPNKKILYVAVKQELDLKPVFTDVSDQE